MLAAEPEEVAQPEPAAEKTDQAATQLEPAVVQQEEEVLPEPAAEQIDQAAGTAGAAVGQL
jgi:hypothetical protein